MLDAICIVFRFFPRSLHLHSELAHMFPAELHVAREMLTFLELEHVFHSAELHGAREMLTFFELEHMLDATDPHVSREMVTFRELAQNFAGC